MSQMREMLGQEMPSHIQALDKCMRGVSRTAALLGCEVFMIATYDDPDNNDRIAAVGVSVMQSLNAFGALLTEVVGVLGIDQTRSLLEAVIETYCDKDGAR